MGKMKFMMAAVAALALGGLASSSVSANYSNGPSEAGVVERGQFPFAQAFVDAEAGLVALGGPPPEEGCLGLGFDDFIGDFQGANTPAGPVVGIVQATQPFYIFQASGIGEVCEAALTTGIDPLAVGEDIRVVGTDNLANLDEIGPGPRNNVFGANATGTVFDADGNAWSFQGSVRLSIDRDGNFEVIKETVKLSKRGR